MSLVNKIVAVVETIAADIKALYTGKAEKEHTHTADQVSGLGTAATKNVVQATGTSTEDVMSQKSVTDNLDNLRAGLDLLRQELNKLKDILPAAIGDERWGGFYIGDITIPSGDDAGTYMVIMAGEEGESKEKWKITESYTTGTTDVNNGKLNTLAMVNEGISEHPAGEYCVNYRGGGFDDWYSPAINEVALAWSNMALLDDLKIATFRYWSSTQTTTAKNANVLNFATGGKTVATKTNTLRVRPVRRIKLEP